MNKQELLKQADYAAQRGNRELARKYLNDIVAQYPQDESAWMLMARIEQTTERRAQYFEQVLKINPNNNEARIGLTRARQTLDPTLARKTKSKKEAEETFSKHVKTALVAVVLAGLFGSTTFAIARNNPDSTVAHLLAIPTPTLSNNYQLSGDVASQTRASVNKNYPQYSPLLDMLIGLAVESAAGGMEGAPERPGAEILPTDASAIETETLVQNALPETGSLSTLMLNELQITSWLAMELKNNPDIPLNEPQVYLRDDKIQLWAKINGGSEDATTSALITGMLEIDANGRPYFEIESAQVGKTVIPSPVVTQVESWLNQALSEKISSNVNGLEVMNVNVSNGLMTISGMR